MVRSFGCSPRISRGTSRRCPRSGSAGDRARRGRATAAHRTAGPPQQPRERVKAEHVSVHARQPEDRRPAASGWIATSDLSDRRPPCRIDDASPSTVGASKSVASGRSTPSPARAGRTAAPPGASGRPDRRSCRGCRPGLRRAPPPRFHEPALEVVARLDEVVDRSPSSPSGSGSAPGPPCRWGQRQGARASRTWPAPCTRERSRDERRGAPAGRAVRRAPRRRRAACRRGSRRRTTTASRTSGMARQRGLDLAGLDAKAANLDLVVEPPQELEGAVGRPAGEVAGPVQSLRRPGRRQARASRTARRSAPAGRGSRGRARRRRSTARRERRSARGLPWRSSTYTRGVGDRPADRHRAARGRRRIERGSTVKVVFSVGP